jgi:hypothetical protein
MHNFTSQFSPSILASNPNTSIGLGGIAPSHILVSFGGPHIPEMNPMIGRLPPFHPSSNPGLNTLGWSGQLGRQVVSYVPSLHLSPPH